MQVPQLPEHLSEIKVSYHPQLDKDKMIYVSDSRTAYAVCKVIWDPETFSLYEQFNAVFLNRRNAVLGYIKLNTGTDSATIVNVKLLLALGLKVNAHSIIVAHNHPSGAIHPSEQDKNLTQQILEGAKLLGMQLVDHIILSAYDDYYSFADEGLIVP